MAKTVENFGKSSELVGRVVRKLENDGLESGAVFHVLDNDKTARTNFVQFANRFAGSSGTTPSYQQARDILGDDFIAPQEVAEAIRGFNYTEAQLAELARTLPGKEGLKWARDNGFAVVAGPPMELDLLDIHELNREFFSKKNDPWFADRHQKFARSDMVGTEWLVIRKVPRLVHKMWSEQVARLSDLEHVPNAAVMTYFLTTYAKVRGIRLVPGVRLRTSSVDSNGCRVEVGDFVEQGLGVTARSDGYFNYWLGVASARK